MHSEFESLIIKEETIVLVTKKQIPTMDERKSLLSEFSNEPLILTETTCTYRMALMEVFRKENLVPNISMELTSIEIIKKSIKNGWGIGFLPRLTVVNDEAFTLIEFPQLATKFFTQIVYPKNNLEIQPFNTFITISKSMIADTDQPTEKLVQM